MRWDLTRSFGRWARCAALGLASELNALSQLQGDLDEMASDSAEDAEESRQARRTVADTFIRQWKINQALYRD